jgi:hypothetical protein
VAGSARRCRREAPAARGLPREDLNDHGFVGKQLQSSRQRRGRVGVERHHGWLEELRRRHVRAGARLRACDADAEGQRGEERDAKTEVRLHGFVDPDRAAG